MALGPTLETQRLIVRPPLLSDFEQWVVNTNDTDVFRNSGSLEDRLFHYGDLHKAAGAWALHGFGPLVLVRKNDGALIGRVGPSLPLDWPEIEVGWALLPEFTGQGYALEGAAAAMEFVLRDLGKSRVIHTIRPANIASQKLAAHLGSRNFGTIVLPAPYQDIANEAWYQTREEWEENRRSLIDYLGS
jgi:RimJ/RimL family protein N-acetyltransferase